MGVAYASQSIGCIPSHVSVWPITKCIPPHSPYHFVDSPLLHNIERVTSYKLIGVLLTNTLSMDMHVNHILSVVNQRLFLLNLLKKQGLSGKAREIIFQALIISRLSYALPAFAGFCLVCM